MPSFENGQKASRVKFSQNDIEPQGFKLPVANNTNDFPTKEGIGVLLSYGGQNTGASLKAPSAQEGSYRVVRNLDTGVPGFRTPADKVSVDSPTDFWSKNDSIPS